MRSVPSPISSASRSNSRYCFVVNRPPGIPTRTMALNACSGCCCGGLDLHADKCRGTSGHPLPVSKNRTADCHVPLPDHREDDCSRLSSTPRWRACLRPALDPLPGRHPIAGRQYSAPLEFPQDGAYRLLPGAYCRRLKPCDAVQFDVAARWGKHDQAIRQQIP